VISTEVDTLGALLGGEISPKKAVAGHRVIIDRDVAELENFVGMFALRPTVPQPAATGRARARTKST